MLLAVKVDETSCPVDVTLLGAQAVMPKVQRFRHLIQRPRRLRYGGIHGERRRHVTRQDRLLRCTDGAVEFALERMKNIQVIDGAENCVYDIFAATDDEFDLVFLPGQDIAFIDEVIARGPEGKLDEVFTRIWQRPIRKAEVMGIHGILFYELGHKKRFYPTRRDGDARNPDGTRLRAHALKQVAGADLRQPAAQLRR
jgi:hypothetical protein